MRALRVDRFSDVSSLEIIDVPDPEIAPDQVLVDIAAAGLGFVDALKIQGRYQTKDPLPFVPGMEVSGVVSRVGNAVTRLRVGDRVFGLVPRGALAERIAVEANRLSQTPERISLAQAAAIPVNYVTALYGLRERAHLAAGETLLILGAAGGTGTAAIKVGKLLGATIVAAASTHEKRTSARAAGADETIDYTRDAWRDELKALTNGRGIDVIFDAVGGEISPAAFRSLRWGGRHLVIGFAAGSIPSLPFNIALLKGASLIGVDSAQIQKHEPDAFADLTSELADLLANGSLQPPPIQTFPFEKFKDAFESIRAKRAIGKVVIEMAQLTS